jgi:D-alanyl-D-alanine carboxypeptidase
MLTLSKRTTINTRFLLTLMSLTCLVACSGQDESSYAQCGQEWDKGVQQIIDEDRAKYGIPGVQVSVSCPGEEQPRNFVSGTTTIDGTTLVKPTDLFQIGSVTKSFIAAILLRLEADGWLSMDDPIGKWLPHQIPSDWKNITIKQLLTHTSGIVNYTETDEFNRVQRDNNYKKQWTSEELISFAINKPPYFQPSEGFHYSNTNYILAGMVISSVPGKSVEKEMKTLLSKTLPSSNTYYLPHPYSKDIMDRMAHGYYSSDTDSLIDATDDNMSMAGTAGAMVSTSEDIASWVRKLLTTTSALPEKQRSEMMSLVDIENGQPIPMTSEKTGYGLGVMHGSIFGSKAWMHGGGTRGYLTEMVWLTCQDVVVTTIINISSEDGTESLIADLISYIQKSDTLNQCKVMDASPILPN